MGSLPTIPLRCPPRTSDEVAGLSAADAAGQARRLTPAPHVAWTVWWGRSGHLEAAMSTRIHGRRCSI
jgi:hypothetical protein